MQSDEETSISPKKSAMSFGNLDETEADAELQFSVENVRL